MPGETVTSLLLKLLAVGALVLLNGFFVAAEFALVKVRETQLAPLIPRDSAARESRTAWSATWMPH